MAQIPVKSYNSGTSFAQKINYKLVYYLGNEYATTDSNTSKYAIATGGWNQTLQYASLYNNGESYCIGTNNNVMQTTHDYYGAFVKLTWSSALYGNLFQGLSYNFSGTYNTQITDDTLRIFPTFLHSFKNKSSSGTVPDFTISGLMFAQIYDNAVNSPHKAFMGLGFRPYISSSLYEILTVGSHYIRFAIIYTGNPTAYLTIYASGFYDVDDITYLSQNGYGNTETAIINSINVPSLITGKTLFNDEQAVKYLVKNCTGSLMIAGLNNSTFVTAMRSSPYFSGGTLLGNEHWGRFIALLDY